MTPPSTSSSSSINRPSRQSDYARFSPTTPIVIDNGGSTFRIGWAGESDPRITFRNVVQRPRHKATGETVTIVGDHDTALMKYFDCTRTSYRSPFDSNVVYQFELMEYVLDYGFERLGANSEVDHPILMTECICNPLSSRSKMAELFFETYAVPSIAFGVDAVFSYKINQQSGRCNEDGLVVCSGFSTSHVIPIIKGEPVTGACCRTNIGGFQVTDYLKQLLSLKHPHHISSITWEKAEELKMEHSYVAQDFASELQLFQKGNEEAKEKTRCWQLPWVPPTQGEVPSEEELARRAALKEKQGQRLRDMAAARKSLRISELENELNGLEDLIEQLDEVEEHEVSSVLSGTKFFSRQEVESDILRVTQSLRKAKGEPNDPEEKQDSSLGEKYPLVSVPDEMLSPDQLKEKKRQIFLKTTSEGRLLAKRKRIEEESERERQNQLEEERRLENPELYLEQLHARYRELCEKVDLRRSLKTNGNHNLSGGVGRGERLSAAQKQRMRLLTSAAFDRGKGEDTFGARDEDWQLYKLMSKDNDDDDNGQDEDEADLARVTSRLQVSVSFLREYCVRSENRISLLSEDAMKHNDIDPNFVHNPDFGLQATSDSQKIRPQSAEDFQVVLDVERFRCPEVLFQPNMIGIDQAGLDEMVAISFRRLSVDDSIKDEIAKSVLVTGGNALLPGLLSRLETGIRQHRPYLSPLKVVRAFDPVLDAWRGAAAYAISPQFSLQAITIQDYYEKGENLLQSYQMNYTI